MLGQHFYHETIKRSVSVFGTLFNRISIKRPDGEILKKVYEYKKKELFKADLKISFHDLFNKYYSNNVEIDLESLQNQTQIKKALLIEKFVKKNIKDYKTGASEDEATTLTNLLIKEYIEKK